MLFALLLTFALFVRFVWFGLFIHLHIYRTVPAPSIPLGPFFLLSSSKYACLLLLFLNRYPQCSCSSCRLGNSRRVGRQGFFPVLSKRPRRLMSMSLCLLFQGYTCFHLSFHFAFLPTLIFIYFILSIFLVPVFVFPRVAFSKGNFCSLSDYRG